MFCYFYGKNYINQEHLALYEVVENIYSMAGKKELNCPEHY